MNTVSPIKLLFVLIFVISTTASAQKKIEINEKLRVRLNTIHELAEENPEQAIVKLDSLVIKTTENNLPYVTIISHYIKGCAYRNIGDYEKLRFNFEKAKNLALDYNWKEFTAEIYRELGDEYFDREKPEKAIENYKKAQEIYKEFGNEEGVIVCTYDGFIDNLLGKYKISNQKLKQLLPLFKKVHPVYLDALNTIAQNYKALNNLDSAFVYVNKMPLDSIDDINNINYSLYRAQARFEYYIAKKNTVRAIAENNYIGKYKFSDDLIIYYYKNKIALAQLKNNLQAVSQFTDSLNQAYEKLYKKANSAEVHNVDKRIETEEASNTKISFFKQNIWWLSLVTIVLLIMLIIVFTRYKANKQKQYQLIINMRNDIKSLLDELKEKEAISANKAPKTIEEKIKDLAIKHQLTERETDVLFHITKGYNNQQIADALFVSVNTIKYHLRNIYEKLDVNKRTEITSKILVN